MRIACISDIHGNYVALLAVFEDIRKRGIEIILCAGDIVGYYPNPIECIELVKKKIKHVIRGNHDDAAIIPDFSQQKNWFNPVARESLRCTREILEELDSSTYKSFLTSLPIQKELIFKNKKVLLAHGTPDKPWEYFLYPYWANDPPPEYEIRINRWFKNWDLVVIGHTHQAYVHNSKISQKVLVNPGSVGQPRDNDPRASYAIVEIEKSRIDAEIIRIEYKISETCKSIKQAFLDDYLCERLYAGR